MTKTLSIMQLQRKLTKFLIKLDGIDSVDGTDFDNHQIEVLLAYKSDKQKIVTITIDEVGFQ